MALKHHKTILKIYFGLAGVSPFSFPTMAIHTKFSTITKEKLPNISNQTQKSLKNRFWIVQVIVIFFSENEEFVGECKNQLLEYDTLNCVFNKNINFSN